MPRKALENLGNLVPTGALKAEPPNDVVLQDSFVERAAG